MAIFPQRSPEYTNCQYLCKLCLVHIENIQGAHKHIKEKRHKKNIMVSEQNHGYFFLSYTHLFFHFIFEIKIFLFCGLFSLIMFI